jgi:hypothetical protein
MDGVSGLDGGKVRRPWWKPTPEEIAFLCGTGTVATVRRIGFILAAEAACLGLIALCAAIAGAAVVLSCTHAHDYFPAYLGWLRSFVLLGWATWTWLFFGAYRSERRQMGTSHTTASPASGG